MIWRIFLVIVNFSSFHTLCHPNRSKGIEPNKKRQMREKIRQFGKNKNFADFYFQAFRILISLQINASLTPCFFHIFWWKWRIFTNKIVFTEKCLFRNPTWCCFGKTIDVTSVKRLIMMIWEVVYMTFSI